MRVADGFSFRCRFVQTEMGNETAQAMGIGTAPETMEQTMPGTIALVSAEEMIR